jgi:hypothetical protein
MPQCELSLEASIKARTSIGPTETQVICRIGDRLDLKHYVWMKNLHIFPVDITAFCRITSEPRVIRFKPADQPFPKVSEDRWSAICDLDTDEEMTFYVSVLSNRNDGTEQKIEVELAVNRWHDSPTYPLEFPHMTILS